jgi:peptide deformylase
MAVRKIITLPDPRLRLVSEPVKKGDPDLRSLIDDMFATMYDAPGIGLAAIQVAVPKRVVVMDLAKKEETNDPRVFINPEVLWRSEERAVHEEGCLSIPENYEDVERPAKVRVKFLDQNNNERELEASELLATCVQHEIDHLNGVLFIDHISKLKRDRVIKKFSKAAKRLGEDIGTHPAEQEITVRSAALSQINAAIGHLHKSDFVSAISLASAAEGILPHTGEPHLFPKLKALIASLPLEAGGSTDINAFNNWTKHGTHKKAKIPEREVILMIARAASKFAAIYGEQSQKMKEFAEWAIPRIQADSE